MLCQKCQKRVANVHFTQVINNNRVEMFLCEQCAKEKGQVGLGTTLNFNDFFSGLMGLGSPESYVTFPASDTVCDKCGMSFEEFQKVGKLGCSRCYELFGERLKPILKRLHGAVEHSGKVTGRASKSIKLSRELQKLKDLLNEAVRNEQYEKAAELRDKIRSLEVE